MVKLLRITILLGFIVAVRLAIAEQQHEVQKKNIVFVAHNQCDQAFNDRLMRKGFVADWQQKTACKAPSELWWVLELDSKKRAFHHRSLALAVSNSPVMFNFEEDLFTQTSDLLTGKNDKGPPKWMPDALIYWDAYIGDWRYLSRPLERQIDSKMDEPELMMLNVRIEDFDKGLLWDASFDLSRLAELFNLTQLRLDTLLTEFARLLKQDK